MALKQMKHKPSLLSWAKRKRINARSEHNKRQNPKYAVACAAHGSKRFKKGTDAKEIIVGVPRNRRERMGGCPICRRAA